MNFEPATGGDDTINGVLYVTTSDGRPVDINAYSKKLNDYGLETGGHVAIDGSGTNGLTRIEFSYFGDY